MSRFRCLALAQGTAPQRKRLLVRLAGHRLAEEVWREGALRSDAELGTLQGVDREVVSLAENGGKHGDPGVILVVFKGTVNIDGILILRNGRWILCGWDKENGE